MAELIPSFRGVFDILSQAGQDKLLYLKHKLKTSRPGTKAKDLLYAMILLTLGQETEARICLDSLKGDKASLSVVRTWEGGEPLLNQADHLASEDQADIQLTVARIYQLLLEENLCEASSRNKAYKAALQAFRLGQDAQLDIMAEAQDLCGHDIHGAGSFQTLRSDRSCFPGSSASASRVNSHPVPISTRSSRLAAESSPQSLHSTGSPASFASVLEISQSPTLPFLTYQPQKRSHRGPSKLCGDPHSNSAQDPAPQTSQELEEINLSSSHPVASLHEQPDSLASVVSDPQPPNPSISPPLITPVDPETSLHSSTECSEALSDTQSLQPASGKPSEALISKESSGLLPGLPPMSVPPVGEGEPTQFSVQESNCSEEVSDLNPPLSTQDPSPSPLSSSLISGPELDTGQRFFSFVVLHAQEDEAIALRVRDTLESLGVPDGATFCEEFQVPGHFELRCLQDAIDNSAFTLLLLTRHFNCAMSLHQVHMALMNSITRKNKKNSVIPFRPRESKLKSTEVSQLLSGLVILDESSPVFSRKVNNTFNPRMLKAQREAWKKEQEIRAIHKQTQQIVEDRENISKKHSALFDYAYNYNLLHQQLQTLNLAFPNQAPFVQGYNMPLMYPWQPAFSPQVPTAPSAFHPNQFVPPMPFQHGSGSAAQPDPQGAGAQPLIIHNAHMLCPTHHDSIWGFLGKDTGMVCHFLLQLILQRRKLRQTG
uniref:TIR domain-containing protein n=1 Tax=Monodelphis domestica TaxID=13616 RepID=F6YR15_MONDO